MFEGSLSLDPYGVLMAFGLGFKGSKGSISYTHSEGVVGLGV